MPWRGSERGAAHGHVVAKMRHNKREAHRVKAHIRAREIRIPTVFIELGNFIYGYFIEFAR